MSEYVKLAICALLSFQALLVVVFIGHPRKPITLRTAAATVAFNGLLVVLISVFWPAPEPTAPRTPTESICLESR